MKKTPQVGMILLLKQGLPATRRSRIRRRLQKHGVAVRYLESLRVVLEHGRQILHSGGNALEVVEQCASLLEDDPLFNAGAGSVLNEDGRVEMDAAIMYGEDLQAGAVAGINNIANPIQLARVVLAESERRSSQKTAIKAFGSPASGMGPLVNTVPSLPNVR